MPASTPRSPSRASDAPGPRRVLHGDSAGVSEVIGYLLVFGILSIVLVLSMSAFAVGQEAAKERALTLHAESAAARVAGVVVQTAVLWEQEHTLTTDVAVAYLVDLPEQLEGTDYEVYLDVACSNAATCHDPPGCSGGDECCEPPGTCTYPERVRVMVPAYDIQVSAPIFSAAAPANLVICDGPAAIGYTWSDGGPVNVRVNAPYAHLPQTVSHDGDHPEDIPLGCTTNELFLEES
jgi:hypothetical protein